MKDSLEKYDHSVDMWSVGVILYILYVLVYMVPKAITSRLK